MKIIYFFIGVLLISGCSVFGEKEEDTSLKILQEEKIIKALEEANAKLDQKNYEEAIDKYKNILVQTPTTSVESVVLFNLGVAEEARHSCEVASEWFRKSALSSKKTNKNLFAISLYKLAQVRNCLGENNKAIVNLIQAKKHSKHLPPEVALTEIPAQLAAAYSRIGNRQLAAKHFTEAEEGLRQLKIKYKNPNKKREVIAKALFMMGNMDSLNLKNVELAKYLESLQNLQFYLLQAVELNESTWSKRAALELVHSYQNIWPILDKVSVTPSKDKDINESLTLELKNKLAVDTMESLKRLKKARFPGTEETNLLKDTFSALAKEELKIQNFIATNFSGTHLTDESKKAYGISRDGKPIAPKKGNTK